VAVVVAGFQSFPVADLYWFFRSNSFFTSSSTSFWKSMDHKIISPFLRTHYFCHHLDVCELFFISCLMMDFFLQSSQKPLICLMLFRSELWIDMRMNEWNRHVLFLSWNGRNRYLHSSLLKIWDFFHSWEKFSVFPLVPSRSIIHLSYNMKYNLCITHNDEKRIDITMYSNTSIRTR
jgi:hypothetical protein